MKRPILTIPLRYILSACLLLMLNSCVSAVKKDLREIDKLIEGSYYQEASALALQSLQKHPRSLELLLRALRSNVRLDNGEQVHKLYEYYLKYHPLDPAAVALVAEEALQEISATPEDQRWLLSMLVDRKGSYSVPTLLRLARNADEDIAYTAVTLLGQTPDSSALDALRLLQQESKKTIAVAAAAELLRRGEEQARPQLEQILLEKDQVSTLLAASAFAALEDERGLASAEKALSSTNVSVVLLAIDVLADLQSKDAVRGLQRALIDGREGIRVRAAEAAGKNASPLLSVSVRKLLKDSSAKVREAAVHALAAMQDTGALALLQNTMRSDKEYRVQVAAAQALRRFRDELGYEFVFGKLKNQDEAPELRALLLEELPLVEDETMIPLVKTALSDAASEVRAAAIHCMVELDQKLEIALWKQLVVDESPDVRLAAAAALSQLSWQEAFPMLANMLSDQNQEVRAQAAVSFFWLRENL